MCNKDVLSDIEQWQKDEDERLEYEGYCNKIRVGIENLDERSGERAIWELVQNARDVRDGGAHIKIELSQGYIIFSHKGKPFDYTAFRALVKQDSSKDRNGIDQVGQYGTGFMTTHKFNRKVYVSCPFAVKSKKGIEGYLDIKDFCLDRTQVESEAGPRIMKFQLEEVKKFCKSLPITSSITNEVTSFRYDLTIDQVEDISNQLLSVTRLLPFVLIINDGIEDFEIDNEYANEHFLFKKTQDENRTQIDSNGWFLCTEKVQRVNVNASSENVEFDCRSLKSELGDVIIIPPFFSPLDVSQIPCLFLWFPLLGTENFGVNFIFHSKRFYPVEKRNNIMLPGTSQIKEEKGGENESVLKEMMETLFKYYSLEENAKTLPRVFCEIDFPKECEDEKTKVFYERMQELWNVQIPEWKIIPIDGCYYSIVDENVKLLHPCFYDNLSIEQRRMYEGILVKYASYVKRSDGQPYLMPSTDLIAWSETVAKWRCHRDNDFFLTIADVCSAIKQKGEDLHSFLTLMKDSGNEKVFDDYALFPNRNGVLKYKKELNHGDFLTQEVYDLVKVVMGEASEKIADPAFLDICSFGKYKEKDLQSAIATTIGLWRNQKLKNPNNPLSEIELSALLRFCSASNTQDSANQRMRLMPLICRFYNKEFNFVHTIKFKEDDEEDFYKTAFNFLLDYTLYQISLKESVWVNENLIWLRDFIEVYNPSVNEERKKRLNDYGVLPNQKYELCLMQDLRNNVDVPEELAEIYLAIFNQDLHEKWINESFKKFVSIPEDKAKDVAAEIERHLVEDMKSENRHFEKIVRKIILNIGGSEDWEEWFAQINDKKATYTFSMKSGNAQKSLFTLMDIDDNSLERLAKLSEGGNIDDLIDKMEHQKELEFESDVRFMHLYTIGTHIENILRERIQSEMVHVDKPKREDFETSATDRQNGQDIVVQIKAGDGWEDVYFIEVKSKWNFTEPAHMSTRQVRNAVLHPDQYALCCVYLGDFPDKDLLNLPEEVILENTKVKTNIGEILSPMIKGILEAEQLPDETQIKISEYRSNMSKEIFVKGESFQFLLDGICRVVNLKLNLNIN